MSQYRNGIINSTGSAVTLALGFVPDKFVINNCTNLAEDATEVVTCEYFNNVTPAANATVYTKTVTTGAITQANITSNGFTPVVLGADWQNTQYVVTNVTNANPGVVTVTVNPANSLVLVNGMTFTFSGVVGMTQLNQNRYVVAGISGSSGSQTFNLYDTFGNPVNTSAFGTYVSGGILNVISYPPIAPVINAVTGQITTQGQPAGNQYDIGYEGITLGTGVIGDSGDVLFWEAWLNTPTGY